MKGKRTLVSRNNAIRSAALGRNSVARSIWGRVGRGQRQPGTRPRPRPHLLPIPRPPELAAPASPARSEAGAQRTCRARLALRRRLPPSLTRSPVSPAATSGPVAWQLREAVSARLRFLPSSLQPLFFRATLPVLNPFFFLLYGK